ncbi:SpoIID/LytB domain-containing protein [Romeria aff. gracilis LEGE 07310]|uniref:SpoIID/LytB domain-containing protein n=1 Tax=Vasconcelosia minhoensis LEGE 07310 TaxID=915328 RepID=A0A8J7DKB2_9CYAN|nr:SpoIID/LytB domain-containing protein [Romeria gracilis]MBE9076176.1 SpoIID/LytB domain-containing protein [Romeria aff. gracilis LEGE 07310]
MLKRCIRLPKSRNEKLGAIAALLLVSGSFAFAPADMVRPDADSSPTVGQLRSGKLPLQPWLQSDTLSVNPWIIYRQAEAFVGPTAAQPSSPAAQPDAAKAGSSSSSAQNSTSAGATAPTAPTAPIVKAAAAPPPTSGSLTIDAVLEMRVALTRDVSTVSLAASTGGVITDLDGNTLRSLSAQSGYTATIGTQGIAIDGTNLPTAVWVYPNEGGYLAIGNSWYRGRLLLAIRETGLIAVNHVLLRDYLYSVVGSEMSPSWSIEALKAQAIAARSYALTHNIRPASNDYYDLDNTPRFQAYGGVDKEANTTQTAVNETSGEFISQAGGIVESLYAASQDIVNTAHGGRGMSQLDALKFAEQGYQYADILAYYYPGTALARLEMEP